MRDWKSGKNGGSRAAESGIAAGKRTLTEGLPPAVQRQDTAVPGKRTLTEAMSTPVQRKASTEAHHEGVAGLAKTGLAGGGGTMPHLDAIQASFGHHDVSATNSHVGGPAAEACDLMGAEAYATGNHVAFRRNPSLHTAAHEAAHVVQQRAGVHLTGGVGRADDAYEQHADAVADAVVAGRSATALLDASPGGGSSAAVQKRSATWLERRAWLSFFDHDMPRLFLNNYMDDTGAAITMTQKQMQDCNPMVDIRRSTAFMSQVARLQAAGGGTEAVKCNGWGGALTNGTLGNFTIHWNGSVEVRKDGTWTFAGTVDFYDFWDFDPKGSGSGRPWPAELKVRIADSFLPGKPFEIFSAKVAASQTSSDTQATWPSAITHVGDHAGRTGADIVVGDIAAGPGGAEVGAQSSEDLNQ